MNRLYLYRRKTDNSIHCAVSDELSFADADTITQVKNESDVKKCLQVLDTIIFLGQPDLYVVKESICSSRNELFRYIDIVTKLAQKEACRLLFGQDLPDCGIKVVSNNVVSSIFFNQLTAQKLSYTLLLKKIGLALPETKIVFNKGEGYYEQLAKDIETKGRIIKFPYSSASQCVFTGGAGVAKLIGKECIGYHYGYINQPSIGIFEDIIEVRFMVLYGRIILCLTKNKVSKKWLYFLPGEQLDEILYERFEEIVTNCFHSVNRYFRLNEAYMRIDVFVFQGELYINEIEPFASGKGGMCLHVNSCEISDGLRDFFSHWPNPEYHFLYLTIVEEAIKKTIIDFHHGKHVDFYSNWLETSQILQNESIEKVKKIFGLTIDTAAILRKVIARFKKKSLKKYAR